VSKCRAKKQGHYRQGSRVLGAFAIQGAPAAKAAVMDRADRHSRTLSPKICVAPSRKPHLCRAVGLLGCRLLLMMMTTKVGCAPVTHPLDMFRARFVLVLSVVIMPQTYVSPSLKSHMSLDTDVATHACHGLGITYSFGHITLIIAGINDLKITGS